MRSTRLAMLAEGGCAWLRPCFAAARGPGFDRAAFCGGALASGRGASPSSRIRGFRSRLRRGSNKGHATKGSKLTYCRVGLIGSMERAARRNIAATSFRLIGPRG